MDLCEIVQPGGGARLCEYYDPEAHIMVVVRWELNAFRDDEEYFITCAAQPDGSMDPIEIIIDPNQIPTDETFDAIFPAPGGKRVSAWISRRLADGSIEGVTLPFTVLFELLDVESPECQMMGAKGKTASGAAAKSGGKPSASNSKKKQNRPPVKALGKASPANGKKAAPASGKKKRPAAKARGRSK